MADTPSKAKKPKSQSPQDSQLAGAKKRKGYWSPKKVTMWLAGPTALLVFFNEVAAVRQFFSPSNTEVKVVVQHKNPNAEAEGEGDPKATSLLVEAARFDEQNPDKLDIVCRNASAQSAFVKTADVEILHVWPLQPVVASRGPLASTANYDLTLPAPSGPTKFEKELIHEIPPKALDRFSITIGAAPSKEAARGSICFA